MDENLGSIEEFISRGKNNFNIRGLHHHVFDESLIRKILEWCGFTILDFDYDETNFFTFLFEDYFFLI